MKGGQQADGCLLHELHARSCFTHFNASNESAGGPHRDVSEHMNWVCLQGNVLTWLQLEITTKT